jgi:hypothetical protein
MRESYNSVAQTRTSVTSANSWIEISIPIGARNPLLACEKNTVSFRVSLDNSINAATQGAEIPAQGAYNFEGINTDELKIYVSLATATAEDPSVMILIYTVD